MRIYIKDVTTECFNRGSTMLTTTLSHVEWVGGPVPISPVVSPVEPPIEDSGMTDSKKSGNGSLRSKLREIKPAVIEGARILTH
jgi:hypothetical protein